MPVRQLQRHGVWLDLFHYLLFRRSALSTALIAPVPWVGTGLASYVLHSERGVKGFVQMLKRPGRFEADVLFLAPDIDEPGGQRAWESLLAFCVENATHHGLRRLFASVPEGAVHLDVLGGLGFMTYTNETIFALAHPSKQMATPNNPKLRPRDEADVWWLRRLYSIYTPLPVQHAEGMGDGNNGSLAMSLAWWELTHQHGYVLDDRSDIRGGVQLVSGRKGHWLLLHGDPSNRDLVEVLLRQGLKEVAGSHWPVYCSVRDYQGGLPAVLEDHGFQPFARRSRLVKHMAVRVKAPEVAAVPGLAVEGPR